MKLLLLCVSVLLPYVYVGTLGLTLLTITLVRATVDYWKQSGRKPFIFPAMGSHGAATAEGQADVLAHSASFRLRVISQYTDFASVAFEHPGDQVNGGGLASPIWP